MEPAGGGRPAETDGRLHSRADFFHRHLARRKIPRLRTRDALPGLYLYVALGLGSALGLGLASAFAARWLVERRSFGPVGASATAVLGFSVLGGVILAISFFAAIVLAEVMRGTRWGRRTITQTRKSADAGRPLPCNPAARVFVLFSGAGPQ